MKSLISLLLSTCILASCGTSTPETAHIYYPEADPLRPGDIPEGVTGGYGSPPVSSVQIYRENASSEFGSLTAGTLNQTVFSGGSGSAQYAPTANARLSYAEMRTELNDEITSAGVSRKLVYVANLRIEVDSADAAISTVKTLTSSLNGYIINSNNYFVSLRVPAAHFEDAMRMISSIGKLKDKTISGRDITDEYYDIQTRLANAENARKRYLDLLAKAENVEAALRVERELERLNGDIEKYKGRISVLREVTSLATINVYLQCKTQPQVSPGPIGYVFVGMYHALKWLFVWD
jgi:hypothetical protein